MIAIEGAAPSQVYSVRADPLSPRVLGLAARRAVDLRACVDHARRQTVQVRRDALGASRNVLDTILRSSRPTTSESPAGARGV